MQSQLEALCGGPAGRASPDRAPPAPLPAEPRRSRPHEKAPKRTSSNAAPYSPEARDGVPPPLDLGHGQALQPLCHVLAPPGREALLHRPHVSGSCLRAEPPPPASPAPSPRLRGGSERASCPTLPVASAALSRARSRRSGALFLAWVSHVQDNETRELDRSRRRAHRQGRVRALPPRGAGSAGDCAALRVPVCGATARSANQGSSQAAAAPRSGWLASARRHLPCGELHPVPRELRHVARRRRAPPGELAARWPGPTRAPRSSKPALRRLLLLLLLRLLHSRPRKWRLPLLRPPSPSLRSPLRSTLRTRRTATEPRVCPRRAAVATALLILCCAAACRARGGWRSRAGAAGRGATPSLRGGMP